MSCALIPVPQTPAEFRAAAPAFSNATMFPDDSITFWLQAACLLLNANRMPKSIGLMTVLFVEHNLALEAYAKEGADNGGIPGLSRGIISSEAAGQVNVSYDTNGAAELNAGHWNLTDYGKRFIRMARFFGAGPIQLNTPGIPSSIFLPWTGIVFGPGWYGQN